MTNDKSESLLRIVAAMVTAIAMALPVGALSFSVGNYKYYTTSDTEVTVDGFSASAPSGKNYVDFPGMVTYGGKTYYVKTVGSYAFAYNPNIEEAVIPFGVTEIEENAFDGCTSLDAVRLPGTMRRLQSD
ncbi:MAG: leucine-rich repeat protein [Muribaculaceae bacterium]|nr:leucine-rich repeat protein [Muribaculaceae bacterium]